MARARTRDAAWLSHAHTEDKPVEWTVFNTYLDRQEASTSTKKQIHWWHLYHFSMRHLPTLTRSWRHSSTWKKTLNTFGMQYAHSSVDQHLYQISCIVQWSDPRRWKYLVLHPRMMHALMSFRGCIGTPMKASGVDVLLTAAFGGVAGIIT